MLTVRLAESLEKPSMSRIKDSPSEIIGKTLAGVVLSRNGSRRQLFLAFDDGTSFEFWVNGEDFSMASRPDNANLNQVTSILAREPSNQMVVFERRMTRLIKQAEQDDNAGGEVGATIRKMSVEDVSADEALRIALHYRPALLERLSKVTAAAEVQAWSDLLVRALANLLANADADNLDGLYHQDSEWHRVVKPPSVVEPELMYFLGALSIANPKLFAYMSARGACQACLKLFQREPFDRGQLWRPTED